MDRKEFANDVIETFSHSKKKIGVDILRHSYIMYMYPKLKTIKEKEELAKRMLHSTAQQEKYNLIGIDELVEEEPAAGAGEEEQEYYYSRRMLKMPPVFKKGLREEWDNYFHKKFGYGYKKPEITEDDYADFKRYINKMPRDEFDVLPLFSHMKEWIKSKFA